MTNEHVLRILRTINEHPAGLTAAWDPDTDRISVEWADFPQSPSIGLLRASTASDADVSDMLRRFIYA